jgi:hypothetical protein
MDAVNDLPDYPLDIYLQKIVPDTTSILEYDGIKLVIPPGAIDREVTIEIIKLKSTFPIKDTIANVTEGAVVYRFGPSGLYWILKQPFPICLLIFMMRKIITGSAYPG